jgi:hypothetical protein
MTPRSSTIGATGADATGTGGVELQPTNATSAALTKPPRNNAPRQERALTIRRTRMLLLYGYWGKRNAKSLGERE